MTEDTGKKLELRRPKHITDAIEAAMNAQLNKMGAAGTAYRDKVSGVNCRRWKHYTDFALGNHWGDYDGDLEVLYTDNCIGKNLKTKANLVNEMHIAAEFHPREPGDEQMTALMNAVIRYYWEYARIPEVLDRAGMIADRIGTGFVKVHWDPSTNDGLGDVRADWVPSENIITEPGKVKFDDCRWMREVSWLDPAEVKTKYGGLPKSSGDENENDRMGDLEDAKSGTTGTMYNVVDYDEALATTTTGKLPAEGFFSTSEEHGKVRREEWYVRDNAIEVTEGDEGEKQSKKKYKNGRYIVRIGTQIVEDKEFPYDHGKWPYARDVDVLDPKQFWGDTDVRPAIPVQKEHNLCFTIIANTMHLNTNTPWLNPFNSGVSNSDLQTNGSRSGGVINHRPNAEPSRMPPGAISNQLFEWFDRTDEKIDKLMGIQDVVPPGARGYPASGEVIEQLRESQLVNIRARANNRARCVRRIVELLGATVAQFYTEARYIRLTGPLPEALNRLAADSLNDPEGPIRPNGKDGYFVKIDPKAISKRLDAEIREATWEPLSKKAQIDQLIKVSEMPGGDQVVMPSDVIQLMGLGVMGDRMARKVEKREAEAAAAPPAPPEQPMGPPPGMGGPMPQMGQGMM